MVRTVKTLFSVALVGALLYVFPPGAARAMSGRAVEPTQPAGDVGSGQADAFVAGPILTAAGVMIIGLSLLFLGARFVIRRRIQRGMAERG